MEVGITENMIIDKIKLELEKLSNPKKRADLEWFFKTGKGGYGEGDKFIAVLVPDQRKIAKKFYKDISPKEITALLQSEYHEHRLTALFLLTNRFEKFPDEKEEIVKIYLDNTKYVNNWDLVDSSAYQILGEWLLGKDKEILIKLAKSNNIWERRIAIVSTYAFIKKNIFEPTIEISEILVNDDHDLIHKAVGWMLREVGKRGLKTEESFLDKHYKTMPRTMLRYAIEKFSKEKKDFYMGR